jgi:hypothetical protein
MWSRGGWVPGVYGTLERRYTVQHMVQFKFKSSSTLGTRTVLYRSNGDTQFSTWYSVVNVETNRFFYK